MAVLCLGVIPHLLSAVAMLNGYRYETWYQDSAAALTQDFSLLGGSIGVIGPMLYIIAVSGEPGARFGLVRLRIVRDLGLGVAVVIAALAAYWGFFLLLSRFPGVAELMEAAQPHGADHLQHPNVSRSPIALAIPAMMANGFAEELVLRAYLLSRIEQITKSAAKAVAISAAAFASYHMYQGLAPMLGIFVVGLTMGAAFRLIRSFWPLAIGHGMLDLLWYYMPV